MADQHCGEGSSMSGAAGESSESTVELNVKTLDSQIYSFHVDKNMLVSLFKEKIANEIGVPVGQQRLIFRGKVLKDDQLLSEYHVENGHTLHLVERQPAQSQPHSSAGSEANENNSNQGNDAGAGGPRNRVGQISHGVVLGTLNIGDQGEGVMPDLNRVIGSVLNSFVIGNQTMTGVAGVQPTVQATQGNVTEGNQAQGAQAFPFQIPLSGLTLPVPSLQVPIPHSLHTLSEFLNRMEMAFTHGGHRPSPSPANLGDLPRVELPSDARGLPTIEALAIVLRSVQRLLNDHVIVELSRIAGRLENEGVETDPAVRGQIQAESMQLGLATQHLGALFLELGRSIMTLRMGQSPAESFVNAGPAVYISTLGPNPIMVQPFPLQPGSLFGTPAVTPLNPGTFGPVGIGSAPRHINIHIHAGTRPSNGEGVQGERVNGTGSNNSSQPMVVPVRNIIAAAVPPRSSGVSASSATQPSISGSQAPPDGNSLSTVLAEVNSRIRNLVDNIGGDSRASSGSGHTSSMAVSGAGEANVSLPVCDGEGPKVHPECHEINNDARSALSSNSGPSTFSTGESMGVSQNSVSSSEGAPQPMQNDNSSAGTTGVPLGLGLGALSFKRRSRSTKVRSKIGDGTSSNPPLNQNQDARTSGQQIWQSLASGITTGRTNRNDQSSRQDGTSSNPPRHPNQHARTSGRQIWQSLASGVASAGRTNRNDQSLRHGRPLGQLMGSLPSEGRGTDSEFDASSMMSQVSQMLSGQTGGSSPAALTNMMDQLTRNSLIGDTVNQIAQQMDGQDLGNMISGLGRGQSGEIDLSRMVQQMMPIVSRALNNAPTSARQFPNVGTEAETQYNEQKLSGFDKLDDQIDLQHVTRRIERCDPPTDIFHAMVEAAQSSGNGLSTADLVNELCSDDHLANEYIEMLRRDLRNRLQGDSRSADKS